MIVIEGITVPSIGKDIWTSMCRASGLHYRGMYALDVRRWKALRPVGRKTSINLPRLRSREVRKRGGCLFGRVFFKPCVVDEIDAAA